MMFGRPPASLTWLAGSRQVGRFVVTIVAALTAQGCCCATPTSALNPFAGVDSFAEGESRIQLGMGVNCGGTEGNHVAVLGCGDHFVAEANGEPLDLEPAPLGLFEATFPVADEGTEFKAWFKRPEYDDPPGASGTLPAPFEITSSAPEGTVSSESDPITITWEPSGAADDFQLRVLDRHPVTRERTDESCISSIRPYFEGLEDDGEHTFEPGAIEGMRDTPCTVALQLERIRRFGDPSNCSDFLFTLVQTRFFTFTVAR